MKGILISMILGLAMVHLMVHQGEAVVDCDKVKQALIACVPYLTDWGTDPTTMCCNGVSDIPKMATTTEERQQACECVKMAASHIPNLDHKAAANLPIKCKVDIGIPISQNTNCQDIH